MPPASALTTPGLCTPDLKSDVAAFGPADVKPP
eukprot:CAMPEP_0179052502 /NCGR_PEP_ID=MMETSP0796-20121207/21791_1 /TAXON_ID=73915 /ORGANISM="Pyrodinium bahamense, Strain pbaha01" /LENGTH=32 /DNA_ID= /DNA_START= /DNA_END= /DNA_ORIENTATION=